MTDRVTESLVPDEIIMNKIYLIRGRKVMLDRDLAELYQTETKHLKRAVRRNMRRFPEDFMFELSKEELDNWRYHFGTSNREIMGLRVPPFAFTEYGVLMLASVLNSDRAILVNIQIVRVFTKMREMLASNDAVLQRLENLEYRLSEQNDKILMIFKYLKQLKQAKQEGQDHHNRKTVGFKRKDEQ
jgi:phage regulator Rha-like protein